MSPVWVSQHFALTWFNLISPIDSTFRRITQILSNDLDYGDPCEESQALDDMAQALSRWYVSSVTAKDLLFTEGGTGL